MKKTHPTLDNLPLYSRRDIELGIKVAKDALGIMGNLMSDAGNEIGKKLIISAGESFVQVFRASLKMDSLEKLNLKGEYEKAK